MLGSEHPQVVQLAGLYLKGHRDLLTDNNRKHKRRGQGTRWGQGRHL